MPPKTFINWRLYKLRNSAASEAYFPPGVFGTTTNADAEGNVNHTDRSAQEVKNKFMNNYILNGYDVDEAARLMGLEEKQRDVQGTLQWRLFSLTKHNWRMAVLFDTANHRIIIPRAFGSNHGLGIEEYNADFRFLDDDICVEMNRTFQQPGPDLHPL